MREPPWEKLASVTLEVDATNTRQAVVSVHSCMTFSPRETLGVRIAEWLPAFHAPSGPVKFMAGFEFRAQGIQLEWSRDPADPFHLLVDLGGTKTSVECAHQFLGPTEASQGRVLMGPNMLRLQWAGLCLYPDGYDPCDIAISPRVRFPEGWAAATALKADKHEDGAICYARTNLRELIDSPVLAGAHHVRARLATNVNLEIFSDNVEQLPQEQEQIDAHANLVAEADAVFSRRPFRSYTFLLGLSDQLGRIGLEHRASSENGVAGSYFTDWERSITEHDLLPHEYVHSWIGKFRIPIGNLTQDFSETMTNELMWVYEGLTQYYGHILAARSSLISVDQTLDAFALIAATYDCRPGRRWRPLGDTIHDPIIAAREPLPWKSWQRSEDYYAEGLLIWLEADMLIRRHSNNKKSLDNFVRRFFSPRCPTQVPSSYDRAELISALNQIQHFDWQAFFEARIDAITPSAPLNGLEMGGYRLDWSDQPSDWHRCDQHHNSYCDLSFSLGIKVGTGAKVIEVIWGSLAFEKEFAVGAVLLEVNDKEYSHDRLREAVSSARTCKRPVQLRVRQQGEERDIAIDWKDGHRFPILAPLLGRRLLVDALQPRRKK